MDNDESGAMHRVCVELKPRLRRWRATALPVAQAALAAGLSWLVAVNVVDHRLPFFAPIAAVICLGVTLGQRLRRGIEQLMVDDFRTALQTGGEIAAIAPIRWRRRPQLERYVTLATPVASSHGSQPSE